MKRIIKTNEPRELIFLKKTGLKDFRKLKSSKKSSLRKKLLIDQDFLCCYCGKSLKTEGKTEDNIPIEHIKCIHKYPEKQLDWNNLLVSCDGGKKNSQNSNTQKIYYPTSCDYKKNNEDISISPLDIDCEDKFIYKLNGEIAAVNDENCVQETIEILGLNNKSLVNLRKKVIDVYLIDEILSSEDKINEIINGLNDTSGKIISFNFVIIKLLKNFLHKQ